jgi:type II secretory pathway pseudopilin PulG
MLEVLVTVAIIAILAVLAVPILNTQDSKLDTAAYNLRTDLMFAKSEAAKSNEPVMVVITTGGTEYELQDSGGVSLRKTILEPGISMTNSTGVEFTPLGTAQDPADPTNPLNMSYTITNRDGETAVIQVTSAAKITVQ